MTLLYVPSDYNGPPAPGDQWLYTPNEQGIHDETIDLFELASWVATVRGICSLGAAIARDAARNIAIREALEEETAALNEVAAQRAKVADAHLKMQEVKGKGINAVERGGNPLTHVEQLEAAEAELAREQARLSAASRRLANARAKIEQCSK